jgi:hypothetical protein
MKATRTATSLPNGPPVLPRLSGYSSQQWIFTHFLTFIKLITFIPCDPSQQYNLHGYVYVCIEILSQLSGQFFNVDIVSSTAHAPEAKRSQQRKSKLERLLLCNIVTISFINFLNAIDLDWKNSPYFIDWSNLHDFQQLLEEIVPINGMDPFKPILHRRNREK